MTDRPPSALRRRPAAPPPPRLRFSRYPYFNRELSWLAFNRRVLEQAVLDGRHPLLERLKFLAIVASNLDEFFEIRVAGLVQQVQGEAERAAGTPGPGEAADGPVDGLGPREQLRRIHSVVASMVDHMYRCWQNRLRPALAQEGIVFKRADELDPAEARWVRTYFREQVYPVLTPLSIDPSHPFPLIANKTLNVLCSMNKPETPERERMMAVVPVPRTLPRIVRVERTASGGPEVYMFISSVLKLCAGDLFPGLEVNAAHVFRVTRNSDLYIDEEEAENLLQTIEEELRSARRNDAVRLEIEQGVDPDLFKTLLDHLNLGREYVFRVDGPLNLQGLFAAYELIDRPDLKDRPFTPAPGLPLEKPGVLFDLLRRDDALLHHPYESFDPVVTFVREAAADSDVVAIKQTLYRTSGDSPIVEALIAAARAGKQVTALIELKARFDEANNIVWARRMEEAGVHVVYGLVGLKIHAKLCLVVRREAGGLRCYAHLGTGNYNPKTARIYTDLSLLTARRALTSEVVGVFNSLTGFGRAPALRHLLVAPHRLHPGIQRLIAREARHARAGRPARIIAKVNSLVDPVTIRNLYRASQAGVRIDLIVRGVCCLVPGVRGLSDHIRVRSIVGRYLEHSRIFYFRNSAGEPEVHLGSADWMPRNFFRRVETVFPLLDPRLRRRVVRDILEPMLRDDEDARELQSNGSYLPVPRRRGRHPRSSQEQFMAAAQAAR